MRVSGSKDGGKARFLVSRGVGSPGLDKSVSTQEFLSAPILLSCLQGQEWALAHSPGFGKYGELCVTGSYGEICQC